MRHQQERGAESDPTARGRRFADQDFDFRVRLHRHHALAGLNRGGVAGNAGHVLRAGRARDLIGFHPAGRDNGNEPAGGQLPDFNDFRLKHRRPGFQAGTEKSGDSLGVLLGFRMGGIIGDRDSTRPGGCRLQEANRFRHDLNVFLG